MRFEFLEHDGNDATELLWEWALADVVLPFMANGFTEANSGVSANSWGEVKREKVHIRRNRTSSDGN